MDVSMKMQIQFFCNQLWPSATLTAVISRLQHVRGPRDSGSKGRRSKTGNGAIPGDFFTEFGSGERPAEDDTREPFLHPQTALD